MLLLTETCRRIYYLFCDFLLAQKDRLTLWLPVAFATGIGFYFSLRQEPLISTSFAFFLCSVFLLWDCRKRPETRLFALFIFLSAAGFFSTQIRAYALSEPTIKARTGLLYVSGIVDNVTELPGDRTRIILDQVDIASFAKWKTPAQIWLNLPPSIPAPKVGDIIGANVLISPPHESHLPNGFDFSRLLYFQQVGGIGSVQNGFKILKESKSIPIRSEINKRIDAVLPEQTSGIAKALITGSAKSVPVEISQNYRDAGIAHVLSVSGLHMSLIAGLVFAVVRTVLALIPAAALSWNTKKIAAIVALIVSFAYLQISGASYPAQRAFIMLAIALTAILLNRRALSVVSVAWAAFFVLLLSPEALVSAGFHLSFAAVVALIAAYEAGIGKYTRLLIKKESFLFYIASVIAGIALTTIIASIATAPFTIYHFSRLPVYSLLGNLLSSTVTGIWVMPALMIGTIAMPFGMEKPFLIFASYGIDLINKSAAFTAGLPHAVYTFPAMPIEGLLLAVFGGLWLCLWKGKYRFLGLIPFCFSMVTPYFSSSPDMLVAPNVMAFKNKDGLLVFKEGTGEQITRKTWLENNRQEKEISIMCPYGLCVYEKNGFKVAYAHTQVGAYDACERKDLDLLFVAAEFREKCPVPIQIDKFDILKAGVFALYLTPKKIEIQTVAQEKGFRPWTTSYPLIKFKHEFDAFLPPLHYKIDVTIDEQL